MCREGWKVRGVVRSGGKQTDLPAGVDPVLVETIGPDTDWSDILHDCDVVAHLAARVHVIKDASTDPLQEYRTVNTAGTERLAQEAAAAGIKRFVYVSTVKVNGEGAPYAYTERDVPAPADAYSLSKWEAEEVLRRIGSASGLKAVILRPPLVYGPGVGANFLRLMKWVALGLPLPLGSIRNCRSMIYRENLVDAIVTTVSHPRAAGETFLVSDGIDLSTPEFVRIIASRMGRKPFLVPCPTAFLKALGWVAGRGKEVDRLTGSLSIDSSKIGKLLDWKPPFTIEEGIRETVKWFTSS
jgi:nucleoside-diphosphate-sugar epimerase